ncbi:MAG: ATP cone domain-containing protein [Xanthomarina gelatinilytica]|uniref:ATP cone domain-containing protein n=1 Tax=Xanthomarina gelatinilytica TaxID=1137281 RepID=UPI003A860918
MERQIFIQKSNGETELFKFEKLRQSLFSSGANKDTVDTILAKIQKEVYDGMSSNSIYKKAFALLKKHNKISASRYSLKRPFSIWDLQAILLSDL